METGSINHAISFLGTRGAAPGEPISRIPSDRASEHEKSQATDDIEPAFRTSFSDEALERANNSNRNKEGRTEQLSEDERAEVRKLKQRDQEVRRHEQAHKAAAGKLASGGPSFGYTRGPDGKQYAVNGEVQIDVSPVSGDPEATIRKMRQVQSAARAPAQPSGADLKVAASAAKQEASARAELRKENAAESEGSATEETTATTFSRSSGSERSREDSEQRFERRPATELPSAYRASTEIRNGGILNLLA